MKTSHRLHPLLSAALIAVAGVPFAPPGLAQEQEEAPKVNVIVNESALDELPYGSEELPLPPPDKRPISRLLIAPNGRIVGTADLSSSPEATVSAAPTTPIQSTELGTAGEETAPTDAEAAPEESTEETTAGEPALTSENTEGLLEGQLRIPFEEESKVIPETVKGQIVGLIERMNSDYGLQLQVLAYASGDDDEIGHARGVSLARALAMRNFLTENGLDLSRMEVRALGNTALEDPVDRVDLIPLVQ
jgi:outer membrane protein OmpA-like peptidoglycan-associated protein